MAKYCEGEPLNEQLGPDGLALPIEKKSFYSKWFENPKSFTNWTGLPGFSSILKWRLFEKDESAVPPRAELDKTIPVEKLEKFEADSPFYASWLGHATVIVHLEGVNFITDPIWAERASPLSFTGPLRYRPPPMKIEDLPQMDFGVVSHDHYDHLDENAVKKISQKNPNMKWFVPLKMKEWMIGVGMNGENITEMNWGDKSKFEKGGKEFEVLCLPAQHWGMRGAGDRNKRLWSGWSVSSPTRKFFYSGDTGFCDSEYKKIGEKFGPFDLAAIPIGAYEPRWIMKSQHINPDEAVEVHKLIRSKYSIGIHWGTYLMGSFEPYLAPKERLEELMETELKKGTAPFAIINMGRIWEEKVSELSL